MVSYEDDDLAHPVLEKPSSLILRPKLKRLKKAASPSMLLSPPSLLSADPMITSAPTIRISSVAPHPAEIRTSSSDVMNREAFDEEIGPESDLDPLFSYPRAEESCDVLCRSSREMNEVGSRKDKETVPVEEPRKEKAVKRRLGLEEEEGDANKRRKKKKERSRKLSDQDGTVKDKKKLEKARKAELEFLHAESQRLLRETRDASFKPLQLVQKPISSVLEKIRLRKLEMLKSCSILSWSDSVAADSPTGDSVRSSEPTSRQFDVKENDENPKLDYGVGCVDVDGQSQGEIPSISEDRRDSQLSTGDDNLLNSHEANPPVSSFMVDGVGDYDGVAPPGHDNDSSSGEESDKENIGPKACNLTDMDSSPKDDRAKAFLDDEAEEEDDSDCDLLRFHENEDENETDEHEELDDIIATCYEDAPIDQEKRNELHQKWLEQQDAAETNNVIQRLKSGQGRGDKASLHGDYDNYDGGEDGDTDGNDISDDDDDDADGYAAEYDDETADKHHPTETTRQSLKKAKQMIARMFTDANDVYIPSDDEETEKDLIRHHILKKNAEPSFVSPVEDENSREVFGLIKKLNIVPGPKKRGKVSASSVFDSLVASGSSNSSSKPSFVKRASNTLPSSHKQGSSSVRAFIFGRDDSNSRSNISTSEIMTDTAQKEGRPAKGAMTDKFSSSQIKSSTIETKVQTDTESGLSLFNILRKSSVQFDQKPENRSSIGGQVITESQAAHQFSAFKVRRRTKMDSRI